MGTERCWQVSTQQKLGLIPYFRCKSTAKVIKNFEYITITTFIVNNLRPNQLPGALNGNNPEPLERYWFERNVVKIVVEKRQRAKQHIARHAGDGLDSLDICPLGQGDKYHLWHYETSTTLVRSGTLRVWMHDAGGGIPLPAIGRDPSLDPHRLRRNTHL